MHDDALQVNETAPEAVPEVVPEGSEPETGAQEPAGDTIGQAEGVEDGGLGPLGQEIVALFGGPIAEAAEAGETAPLALEEVVPASPEPELPPVASLGTETDAVLARLPVGTEIVKQARGYLFKVPGRPAYPGRGNTLAEAAEAAGL